MAVLGCLFLAATVAGRTTSGRRALVLGVAVATIVATVVGLAVLVRAWLRLQRGWLASSQLAAAEVFWYFVVGLWPVLYLVVYL